MSAPSMSDTVPLPPRDEYSGPYWDALAQGEMRFPRCRCGHAWLPPSRDCPRCLRADWGWERASGDARLVSWVVYHHAFHPAFADRLPYAVGVIELAEGPRLISAITGAPDPEALHIDQAMHLTIEADHGMALPKFRPATGG